MKTNYKHDLCDRVRNMAEIFDFERIKKGNKIRYIRYGVQYVPVSSTRLKKQRRVSAAPEEIKRFNDTYIKSRAAARQAYRSYIKELRADNAKAD